MEIVLSNNAVKANYLKLLLRLLPENEVKICMRVKKQLHTKVKDGTFLFTGFG